MPPQFFSGIFSGDDRITSVLSSFHTGEINPIENEIAALINKLISADKIKLKSGEEMAGAISKTCGYLNLGLETLCGPDAGPSAYREAVNRHFLEDIFRCGSSRVIRLKTIAAEWFRKSFINANHLPLSFLGEQYLGTLGGLFLERPMYYANPVKGDLYQNFQTVREINDVRAILDQIIALDQFLSLLDVDIATFSQGVLTWQTLILTLWARDRIGLERSLEPIPVKAFKPFFSALFQTGKEMSLQAGDLALWAARITEEKEAALPQGLDPVISGLIREIESEYGSVSPDDIDPRFMPHFFLESSQ